MRGSTSDTVFSKISGTRAEPQRRASHPTKIRILRNSFDFYHHQRAQRLKMRLLFLPYQMIYIQQLVLLFIAFKWLPPSCLPCPFAPPLSDISCLLEVLSCVCAAYLLNCKMQKGLKAHKVFHKPVVPFDPRLNIIERRLNRIKIWRIQRQELQ